MAERYPVSMPDYAKFKLPVVATGKKGLGAGKLFGLRGVAIHEITNQIYLANFDNNRVEIFSETGEYLNQLGGGNLSTPYGIAIHGDNLYVSSWKECTVSQYNLTDMSLVRETGGRGSKNGEFDCISQLTTDPNGHVFVADCDNDRICVHDTDLQHIRNIKHRSLLQPFDVKVTRDRVHVLCPDNNPCMLVLTLEGVKIHSLISKGQGKDVLDPWFFCLDPLKNFVVSDHNRHSIRVFSPQGKLLHTIGREGHGKGKFYQPTGIAITPNGKLVSVSWSKNYPLQIFY